MFTITTTREPGAGPATDLGYILHKHPDRLQTFDITYGKAHVFYPEASPQRCSMALILEIDSMKIAGRGKNRQIPEDALQDYVNDRPYAATSHLTSAMMDLFSTAISGRCNIRPELPAAVMPLEATVASLPCSRDSELIHRFFEPLGYEVTTETVPLDDDFPEWGMSRFHNLEIKGCTTVQLLLKHLCALIPALDNSKHYYVGDDEIAKLMRLTEGWIQSHPERDIITRRYLGNRKRLIEKASATLKEMDDSTPEEEEVPDGTEAEEGNTDTASAAEVSNDRKRERAEEDIERPLRLMDQRIAAVMEAIRSTNAQTVADLGCGEGQLLRPLLEDPRFTKILGMDVSQTALDKAARILKTKNMTPAERQRLELLHSSLIYRDKRIQGFGAAVAMEVIEHIDPPKVEAFTQVTLGEAQPGALIVTTPNVEYNQLFSITSPSGLRHRDHRFEWTREEFREWAEAAAERHGYRVEISGIGNPDEELGPPTQMAVFTKI